MLRQIKTWMAGTSPAMTNCRCNLKSSGSGNLVVMIFWARPQKIPGAAAPGIRLFRQTMQELGTAFRGPGAGAVAAAPGAFAEVAGEPAGAVGALACGADHHGDGAGGHDLAGDVHGDVAGIGEQAVGNADRI